MKAEEKQVRATELASPFSLKRPTMRFEFVLTEINAAMMAQRR